MSKKSKQLRANRKRKKTIIEHLKCEANNYKALADQYGLEAERSKALHAEAKAEASRLIERGARRGEEQMRLQETINQLKLIIADNERTVAEQWGTIRALERQIDQAAPKVMVRPAVFASPRESENQLMIHSGRGVDMAGLERAIATDGRKKHWTAL